MIGVIYRLTNDVGNRVSVSQNFIDTYIYISPIIEYGSIIWDQHKENGRQLEKIVPM